MCSPLVVVVAEIVIADAASVRMRWDSRAAPISLCPFLRFLFASLPENRVFYYCRTYYKAVHVGGGERECCLLVLNLVSSTLSCIRQPRPRLRVLDVCGFV